jgi:hypothetical protein
MPKKVSAKGVQRDLAAYYAEMAKGLSGDKRDHAQGVSDYYAGQAKTSGKR